MKLCDLLTPWERLAGKRKLRQAGRQLGFGQLSQWRAGGWTDGWTRAKNGVENSQRPENKGTDATGKEGGTELVGLAMGG